MLRCLLLRRPLHFSLATDPNLHRPFSKTPDSAAFTVSYLVNTCGLSLPAALSASKRFRLRATERPDSVLALLRDHGFTKLQIATVVAKLPSLLAANPDETLRPKLDFFLTIGCSRPELAKLLSADPNLLFVSLHNRLRPNFNLLKTIFATDRDVIAVLKRSLRLLQCDLRTFVLPNLEALRSHGVPGPKIVKLATSYPRAVMQNTDRVERGVQALKQMGLDPASPIFIFALNAVSGLTESTWERKLALYKSLGWSKEETISAFMRHPFCMTASDEKIKRAMRFFVGELGWDPSDLAVRPKLLLMSFEKRIVPWCTIRSILVSKGLLRNMAVHTLLSLSEKDFVERFVAKYGEEVPEILEAYQGKRKFVDPVKRDADASGEQE